MDIREDTGGTALTTAVIFVNYHSESLIAPRAAALVRIGLTVAVGDNSGTYVGEASRIVRLGRNVGFGGAVNAAVRDLPPEVTAVVLHNPDVDCDAESIHRLVSVMARQPRPGAVAPAIAEPRMTRRAGFAYPHPLRELVLTRRGTRSARTGVGTARVGQRRTWPFGRRFATAALLVVDRSAFDAIGGFDERYFLYGEDLDLWHRLQESGRDVAFAPHIAAQHATASGSPMQAPRRELLRQLGIELYFEAFSPRWLPVVRRIHLRYLPALAPDVPDLAAPVGHLWRTGVSPSDVARAVRPMLEAYRQ